MILIETLISKGKHSNFKYSTDALARLFVEKYVHAFVVPTWCLIPLNVIAGDSDIPVYCRCLVMRLSCHLNSLMSACPVPN